MKITTLDFVILALETYGKYANVGIHNLKDKMIELGWKTKANCECFAVIQTINSHVDKFGGSSKVKITYGDVICYSLNLRYYL